MKALFAQFELKMVASVCAGGLIQTIRPGAMY